MLQSRADYGTERYERVEFQRKVSECYSRFKELSRDDDHWVTVAAESKTIDEIHQEILERVVTYISEEADKNDLNKMKNSLFTGYWTTDMRLIESLLLI